MNLIQQNTREVKWFTSLREVEKWMEIDLEDFDWHFSDVVGGWTPLEDPSWVTGRALKSKINELDYQFIWAVISAFPAGTQPKLREETFADGNSDFWKGIPEKQMTDALFEIVCWDSSATLWIGLPDDLGIRVLKNAPGIADLDELNKKLANKT